MKNQIGTVNATPAKRLYLSIIADYDINRSICELVDNAVDVWVRGGKSQSIIVKIKLDSEQQTIYVEDNAGGLQKDELRYIVGPGQTGTDPSIETIGIFGVGSKRSVVALAQDVKIKTRYPTEKTYQIDFNDDWLEKDDDWVLPVFEVDQITEGSTIIELLKLRSSIDENVITQLRDHLGKTYAKIVKSGSLKIELNGEVVNPKFFDNWAYPPKYGPRKYTGEINCEGLGVVRIEAYAGLTLESSPATGDYGVYFYCNNRLIARALKTMEVGFIKGYAGQPHPKVSLTRVIICLNGDARSMPWNSSKSDINTNHPVFLSIQDWLMQVVKDYAQVSRAWTGSWQENVFNYSEGEIEVINIGEFSSSRKSYLPPLPKMRKSYIDQIIDENKQVGKKKPWTKGLYESIIAVEQILKNKNLEERNRLALIILDSTLEIAFKEYLVYGSGNYYTNADLLQIFSARYKVQQEIKKYIKISNVDWGKIDFYYNQRCKLTHERAAVGINDTQIDDYKELVEKILNKLFKLNF